MLDLFVCSNKLKALGAVLEIGIVEIFRYVA
jgi:hypothetical protein